MLESVAHLLTPVCPKGDESGWTAIQLQSREDTTSLLFVYRLEDACHKKLFHMRELDGSRQYGVKFENNPELPMVKLYGNQLMNEGLDIRISNRNNSEIVTISPI